MRRKRLPGTRKPFSEPLSKQRIIVCWLTLQILAASPVVNTVLVLDITSNHPSSLMAEPTHWRERGRTAGVRRAANQTVHRGQGVDSVLPQTYGARPKISRTT